MPEDDSTLPVSSSLPPDFPAAAVGCYRGALECLQRAGIPFAVGGAFALHEHTGIWRETKDLDILLEARCVPDALTSLEQMGFQTRIEDPIWLAKAIRGGYFVDLITALGNAVMVVDAVWIQRSIPYQLFGVPCRVLNAEEIIASKVFVSHRERFDGADVAHLIRCRGRRLDWDRIQQLMNDHWEMLLWSLTFFAYVYPAHIDLVPERVWKSLLGRFEELVRNPPANGPFRGTLIDPNMFAIDVNEWGERDLYREYCERHPCLLKAVESKRRSPQ